MAALTYAFKRNLVSRGIDAAKIHVVRNGVDASRYGVRPRNTTLATNTAFRTNSSWDMSAPTVWPMRWIASWRRRTF